RPGMAALSWTFPAARNPKNGAAAPNPLLLLPFFELTANENSGITAGEQQKYQRLNCHNTALLIDRRRLKPLCSNGQNRTYTIIIRGNGADSRKSAPSGPALAMMPR